MTDCKIWNTREITAFSNLILHVGRASIFLGKCLKPEWFDGSGYVCPPTFELVACPQGVPDALRLGLAPCHTDCPAPGWGWALTTPLPFPAPMDQWGFPDTLLWISHPIMWVMFGYLVLFCYFLWILCILLPYFILAVLSICQPRMKPYFIEGHMK